MQMETACSSVTSIPVYHLTCSNIPENLIRCTEFKYPFRTQNISHFDTAYFAITKRADMSMGKMDHSLVTGLDRP
jgi:hypothetical protein